MSAPNGYIDLHTHHPVRGQHTGLYNHIVEEKNEKIPTTTFSAGIHPWYIQNLEVQMVVLEKIISEKNCLAIGECGLDKDCRTPFDIQQKAFVFQCELAVKYKKPLVLHAVKAHFEIINILNKTGIKKAVYHGYNNRYTILEKILENGFYVSMGGALSNPSSQASALIGQVPIEKLFLETDDSHLSIEEIYSLAAEKRKISVVELQEKILINFNQLLNT